MASPASHGSASRRPLVHNGRRHSNLYVRTDAMGRSRFEFQTKVAGKTSRITLDAATATDAIREADRLRVVSADVGICDGKLRLDALVRRFMAESRSGEYAPARGAMAATTLDLYEQRLDSYVIPALGASIRVRDIKVEHLRRLIDRMRLRDLSGSTIRSTVTALRAALRFGVQRGLLHRNPCLDLDGDLPSAQRRTEPVYLTREQGEALLTALSDEFRPVAAACLFAGLRISEALGLTWGDLDLAAGTLTVRRQLSRDGQGFAPLKTRSSSSAVAAPAPLLAELRAHRDRQAKVGFERIQAEALVFVTRSGRSPGRRNALRAVQVQAELLDLRNADGELLGLHDLRHSTAGLLRTAGLSDEEIAVVLRHKDARVTTLLYGSRSDEARQSVREKAASALA